jgi:RNA polymerase sigma-70 factor (TIGR02960 family)
MDPKVMNRARGGDELAFRELTDPYRRELEVHCYRLLGSLTDAEDMLQETLLAAWRGLGGFEERASLRTWLYRIATNRCLNELRYQGRRIPAEPVPPFEPPEPTRRSEITWLEPYPEVPDTAQGPEARYATAESIELAFVSALQRMPPRQAAALILRDVLGFSTGEVAAMLGSRPTAVKGLLQRARVSLEHHRDVGPAPRPAPAAERDIARRFADAYLAADVDGLIALLTDDAWLRMPPAPHEYQGAEAIRSFLGASFRYRGGNPVYLMPVLVNGQTAFGSYIGDTDGAADAAQPVAPLGAQPGGIFVLTMAGGRIGVITRFLLDGTRYPRFGLPEALAAGSPQALVTRSQNRRSELSSVPRIRS